MKEYISIILIVALLWAIIMWGRNKKVYNLRLKILHAGGNYEGMHKFYPKLPSYNRMVFSLKSIRLNSYFNKREIEELSELFTKPNKRQQNNNE